MYESVVALSVLLYVAIGLAFVRSRLFSAFHPFTLYCMFHGIVFVLRPALGLWLDYQFIYRAYKFTPSVAEQTTAQLVANLGFVAFAFFSLRPSSGGVEMRFVKDRLIEDERARLSRLFVWVALVSAPVAMWSLWGQFGAAMQGKAYADMLLDRSTGIAYNTEGSGYFYEAQLMLVPLTTILAWVFRFRLIALVPLATFVLIRAATGGRGPFIAALFATGLFYLHHLGRRYPSAKVTAGLVAAAALFAAIGSDRGQGIRAALGAETGERVSYAQNEPFMGGMDLANKEYLEYAVYVVPGRSGTYTYFTELLQIFTEPVPRVLWPDKPIGPPIRYFSMFDYGYPIGATWSLPGVGWMGLGWAGVILLCGIWGYALGWLYRRFVESDQSTFKVAAYMCFMPIMIVAFRDGLILTVLRQALFYLSPVVLWIGLARVLRIPMASEFRAALRRLRRRRGEAALQAAGQAGEAFPPGLADLPPAVRRRRLAMAERGNR